MRRRGGKEQDHHPEENAGNDFDRSRRNGARHLAPRQPVQQQFQNVQYFDRESAQQASNEPSEKKQRDRAQQVRRVLRDP
ncbi:hypothetical protein D3C83_14040 [compost metagenome]